MEKTTSPSELDQRITLQAPTRVGDGQGGSTVAWVDIATVWAKAWTVSSSEGQAAGQTSMTRIQKFKVRYRSVLRPSWRVKWGDRYFAIGSIDPDGREWIFLTCKEAAQ